MSVTDRRVVEHSTILLRNRQLERQSCQRTSIICFTIKDIETWYRGCVTTIIPHHRRILIWLISNAVSP